MKDRLTPVPVEEQIKKATESGIEKMVAFSRNKEEG